MPLSGVEQLAVAKVAAEAKTSLEGRLSSPPHNIHTRSCNHNITYNFFKQVPFPKSIIDHFLFILVSEATTSSASTSLCRLAMTSIYRHHPETPNQHHTLLCHIPSLFQRAESWARSSMHPESRTTSRQRAAPKLWPSRAETS